MYIVNYGNGDGWQILSSDARTPAVIAEGESGSFSVENGSPAVQVWLDCTAADIAAVKRARDEELSFSAEDIEANRAVWGKGGTRVLPGPEDEGGHWVRELVLTETLTADAISHMTPKWDQWAPYSAYTPYQSNSTVDRAPAGCVALAASGMLYYLHYKLGVPSGMVSFGYCNGDVNNDNYYFGSTSDTVWAQMDPEYHSYYNPADAEALMIGFVGRLVNTNYGNEASSASMTKIRTQLFPFLGLSCSQGSYNADTVKRNLNGQMPVIVSATDLLIPINGRSHCFIIDGYKKTFKRKTYYHYWVWDDPWNPKSPIDHEPYYSYVYTAPVITSIKINWGWWTQWDANEPVNDGWYSLTANWLVTNGGNTYSYNHNVEMLYDISVAN